MVSMRKASIREARQNLSALLDEVRTGREILITERGRPIARLVPANSPRGKGVPNLAAFRRKMPVLDPPLSTTVAEERGPTLEGQRHTASREPWVRPIANDAGLATRALERRAYRHSR